MENTIINFFIVIKLINLHKVNPKNVNLLLTFFARRADERLTETVSFVRVNPDRGW